MPHNYKALVKMKGATGFPAVYRQTPHAAVNGCYGQVQESVVSRIKDMRGYIIELWKCVPTRYGTHYMWERVCTLSVHGTRFLGKDPKGREFSNELPLPKWTNPGANIIQG